MKIYTLLLALLVASCGGGGGGGTASVPIPVPVPVPVDPLAPQFLVDLTLAAGLFEVDVSGITDNGGGGGGGGSDGGVGGGAGDGSALRRATVVLIDSTGKNLSGITDDKGNYLIKFKTADFTAPFVLKVIDAGGNSLAAPSELAITPGKVARVNINPLTDKIISDVLSASVKGTDKGYNGSAINVSGLAQAKANLLASIQSALATAGVANSSQFDPVRSVYKYDGTGVDTVIESVSHNRDPLSGLTQLRAKLAPLTTNADGTIVPTLITASSPLATPQVAIASNPAMTFTKITNWVNFLNGCLKDTAGFVTTACDNAKFTALSTAYKQNSRSFEEDFRALFSDPGSLPVLGSELRNPNILFTSRYPGSTTDDLVVVEITIRQPRVGSACSSGCPGGLSTTSSPVEYTKNLIFMRDDVTSGLNAGNWILKGNQRSFNWSVDPRYFTSVQQNPAKDVDVSGGSPSRTTSGIRLNFNTSVFNAGSQTYVASDVYAIRLTGPGLPAAGVVFAPNVSNPNNFAVLNKTGSIPAPGTKSFNIQSDFRMSGVLYPSGANQSAASWLGTGGNNPVYATTTTEVDFSTLQAFNQYKAEFYLNSNPGVPITESTRILAPVEQPSAYVQRPLHDLSPSLAQITPPQPSGSSFAPTWVRNSLATRIESAFFGYRVGSASPVAVGVNLSDAFSLTPSSTSTVILLSTPAPATNTTAGSGYREIGMTGSAARASFQHSVIWLN